MPSKTSWFSKEIAFQNLRTVGWVGFVYLAGLLFAVPLKIIMLATDDNQYFVRFENLFSFNADLQWFLTCVIPVLLSIFLFRYLQVKNASDLIHSLPIKRTRIFNQYLIMGILMLIIPVVLTGITLLILHSVMDVTDYYSLKDVLYWLLDTIITDLLIFMSGVLVAMITGLSAVQGGLTYVLLLFPAGIGVLISYNLKFLLTGFPYDYFTDKSFDKISPISQALNFPNMKSPMSVIEIIIYLILAVVFYFGSIMIYKKRKLEAVSQAIAFSQLRPVFKYSMTFCFMLLGGFYFGGFQGGFFWIIFGYIIGSLIGYLIAEMILHKTWRVLTRLKGYVIYAVIFAVVFGLFQFDITGYEKRVPKVANIESVYLNNHPRGKKFFEEPQNIELVRNLHEKIIGSQGTAGKTSKYGDPLFFVYKLKNGDKVMREYRLQDKDRYIAYLKPLYESNEYKQAHYKLLSVNVDMVDKITISTNGRVTRSVSFVDPKDIIAAISNLKDDIENETYEDMTFEHGADSNVEILLKNDKRMHLDFKPSYSNLKKWLKAKGQLKNAVVNANDISSAIVIRKNNHSSYKTSLTNKAWIKKMLNKGQALKVTNKDKIEMCLDNFSWGSVKSRYDVVFNYKNGNMDSGIFDGKHTPAFVEQYFNGK
ncbi:ABC-2 type transport system permease protein [Scopulibacillus darangshiensis]|uniref:ABC-2 type transport system permease protein n=1 Tax=Scopulibacillus darangshiensis TaxID=442528 RepID=A0A4R2P5C4_9BACL|nr:DUF6449 domain-containing protein [Scopulibacillus darangshiensis]TCP29161.1 ABC-2 type transport system permease protein [Scopulibacillus darangshiensis]